MQRHRKKEAEKRRVEKLAKRSGLKIPTGKNASLIPRGQDHKDQLLLFVEVKK